MTQDPIYLDHAAGTPLRPEARAAMDIVADESLGNPSAGHRWGRMARTRLENARERIASLLGAAPDELRFVRGGTESVNVAILGAVRAALRTHGRATLYRSTVEHSSSRGAADEAAREGCDVRDLAVSTDGAIDLPDDDVLATGDVALVTAQRTNQETGLLLDLAPLAEQCNRHGVPLHVDAVQALGKVPLSVEELSADLISVSAHKIGGPRSLGALVVRRDTELHPLMFGGGQEGELRPGTEDVAGAVGFAAAVESTLSVLATEAARLGGLRDGMQAQLVDLLPEIRVHGAEGPRAPHILNLGVPGVPRDVLVAALDLEGVGASAGSACQSGATRVSWVLEALYGADAHDTAPLRLSLGWTTTSEEVDRAAKIVAAVVGRARMGAGYAESSA